MICFTWSRGHFCFKNIDLLDENARSVSGIAESIHHRKDSFSGIANGSIILRTFWWENELSKFFGFRDKILPMLGNGFGQKQFLSQDTNLSPRE